MKHADLLDNINELIEQKIVYLKHYQGQIVAPDPFPFYSKTVMRAKVLVPELGIDTPDIALTCYPREGRSSTVPQAGDSCEVYFMNGDPGKAVYLHPLLEHAEQGFTNAVIPTQDVLYEERNGLFDIIVNKIAGFLHLGGVAAVKPCARATDPVQVVIPPGTVLIAATGGVPNPTPIPLTGNIVSGSFSVFVKD